MKEIGNAEVVKEIPKPESTEAEEIKIKPKGDISVEEANKIYEKFEKMFEADGKTDRINLDDWAERKPGERHDVNGAGETGEKEVKEEEESGSEAGEVKDESGEKQTELTDEENAETDELAEKKGGSYGDVKKTSDGETQEVHHMPADSVSDLERDDGPAIKMEKEDHRQTASWGRSREAQEYRERQKALIEQGKFREALQMDIDDIHEKFGDKYDDAIDEMLEYVDKLEEEGKING